MSLLGKGANSRYTLNNLVANAPEENKDLRVTATFDNGNNQANVSIRDFTFVNEEYQRILKHIEDGLNGGVGIYEMIPYTIEAFNIDQSRIIFDGFIDTTTIQDFSADSPRVNLELVKVDGLNILNDKLEGFSYPYLESIGVFGSSDYEDLDYLVEKKIQLLDILVVALTIFFMTKIVIDVVRDTAKDNATVLGVSTAGLTGGLAGAILFAALLIIQILYYALLIVAILALSTQTINTFFPPRRTHRIITFRKLLEKVINHIGYDFESPISELDTYYFLPSNPQLDDVDSLTGLITKTKGVLSPMPRANDPGFLTIDMFNIIQNMFYARMSIVDNVVHFRTERDPWWNKVSNFKMKDVILVPKTYNTEENKKTRRAFFQTDNLDEWTIDNFKGTNVVATVEPIIVNNEKAVKINGSEVISFPWALGNRKDQLNALESVLATFAESIDQVIRVLGGNSNLANAINSRVGLLKVSNNNHTIPKVLNVVNGSIPANHRENLSAIYLYNNYINGKSFVANNFGNQKTVYRGIKIPFVFENFLETIDENAFSLPNGKIGKFESIDWEVAADFAICDFYVEEIHSTNLRETLIEGE